jgi:hypothetical protein
VSGEPPKLNRRRKPGESVTAITVWFMYTP